MPYCPVPSSMKLLESMISYMFLARTSNLDFDKYSTKFLFCFTLIIHYLFCRQGKSSSSEFEIYFKDSCLSLIETSVQLFLFTRPGRLSMGVLLMSTVETWMGFLLMWHLLIRRPWRCWVLVLIWKIKYQGRIFLMRSGFDNSLFVALSL